MEVLWIFDDSGRKALSVAASRKIDSSETHFFCVRERLMISSPPIEVNFLIKTGLPISAINMPFGDGFAPAKILTPVRENVVAGRIE
jgi:hypothetical protein